MPHDETMQVMLASFNDPDHARRYSDGPQRVVPGFADLHRMTAILLAERAPDDARVLVLGAGGGLELRALANVHPSWTFIGTDPAGAMLDEAIRFLASRDGTAWRMFRAFSFKNGDTSQLRSGLLAQSPVGDGMVVRFTDIRYETTP